MKTLVLHGSLLKNNHIKVLLNTALNDIGVDIKSLG